MTLALSALAMSPARADEPQQFWSARPSLRLSNELVPAQALVSPLSQGTNDAATGVVFDRNGRISLGAGLGVDTAHNDNLATLPWCAEASGLLRVGEGEIHSNGDCWFDSRRGVDVDTRQILFGNMF